MQNSQMAWLCSNLLGNCDTKLSWTGKSSATGINSSGSQGKLKAHQLKISPPPPPSLHPCLISRFQRWKSPGCFVPSLLIHYVSASTNVPACAQMPYPLLQTLRYKHRLRAGHRGISYLQYSTYALIKKSVPQTATLIYLCYLPKNLISNQ